MEEARESIPVPAGLPIFGNILSLQGGSPIQALERLADLAGPVFRIKAFGFERIVCADAETLEELCDEKRFWKGPSDALQALGGKEKNPRYGLFAAPTQDHMDWQVAHRILVPAFGPLAIEKMYPEMYDLACQLVLKWARMGPSYRIPATLDFTRLTLDTIALCSMDFRFNSFYAEEMHPFVKAMNTLLSYTNDRFQARSVLMQMLPWDKSAQEAEDAREYMKEVARELVQSRRENPTAKQDLLNAMVNGKDPKSGQMMDDDLITANMVTFLVAGHETTSGLLSFAFFCLLKNPETYFKAQQEVDRVVGKAKLTAEHLKDLNYLNAVLRETIRLFPTAPAFIRAIRKESQDQWEPLAGGKYALSKDDKVICLLIKSQKDPKVYGEDAKEFKPDRMLDENFEKLPKGAWKPFGTGLRACIGRAFAWQESLLVMAVLLQNFNLSMDDPKYEMKIKQTLTIKPDQFFMRASLREGISATNLQARLADNTGETFSTSEESTAPLVNGASEGTNPMTILYGSNTGTCQSLAERLSVEARKHGFHATVMDMDAAVGQLPKEDPVVVITASYEGEPPDNAGHFVAWLESLGDQTTLQGVRYAVFGCGHSDWATTFQRIPTLCDDLMTKHGAERVVERGLCNAAKGDIFSTFDAWIDGSLWPAISTDTTGGEINDSAPALDCEMSTQNRGSFLRQDVKKASVVAERRLTAPDQPEKRHLEVELPEEMEYETGDYLAILPQNPEENVKRVLKRFQIPAEATITIKPGAPTFLPTGVRLSVRDLLKGYVELSSPVTKKDLKACIDAASQSEKSALQGSVDDAGFARLSEQKVSLLDLIEQHKSVALPFTSFLAMLPPLRPRHYSISSSPASEHGKCTITYAVIDEAARSGTGRFIGVTGAYLAGLRPGDEVLVSVRSTNKFFHLPADPDAVPIMMFCGGSGLAPFRGFIQERAAQIALGRRLAPALLFVGCRSATKDRLYAAEMDAWRDAGVVDVRYAFSRESDKSAGCAYVQDRMERDRADILRLWRAGAKVFTCGGTALSARVAETAKRILVEVMQEGDEKTQITEERAEEWFRKRRNERFVVDVFDS